MIEEIAEGIDQVEARIAVLFAKRRKAAGWYTLRAIESDSNAVFVQFSRNASRIFLGEADHRLDAILAEQAEYDA